MRSIPSHPIKTPATQPRRIGIVGAGLSGLVCARSLAGRGHRVRVFEKSRGPGGRMSTRHAGALCFDHGAQYFTTRDARFQAEVRAWQSVGLVEAWNGRIAVLDNTKVGWVDPAAERYVGVPGMDALCRNLAADLEVSYGARVVRLDRRDGGWRLETDAGADVGPFDAVVVSAPAPQTAAVLADVAPGLAERAASVEMAPCWAVMVRFGQSTELGFDGAFVHDSPLSWIARNSSKPGRPSDESWVLHGSPEWSAEHLELDSEIAAHRLTDAFRRAVGRDLPAPDHLVAHRWRFALPVRPLPEPCLVDPELALAACGDWAGGPRVEGAFLSGCATAARLLGLWPGAEQAAVVDGAD